MHTGHHGEHLTTAVATCTHHHIQLDGDADEIDRQSDHLSQTPFVSAFSSLSPLQHMQVAFSLSTSQQQTVWL